MMIIQIILFLNNFFQLKSNAEPWQSYNRGGNAGQNIKMKIGWIHKLVNKWPGKKTFGVYRFLPIFFVLGAALEFSMINWKVGEVNFYNTFKKRQAKDIVEDKIRKYSAI